MSALAVIGAGGFLRRVGAMLRKELLQLRRDRVTLATMISIPLLQLTLFGYAINTTPRNLPTAVLLQESSDVGRSILAAIQNTKYFKVTRQLRDEAELDEALKSGQVLFAVEIPANFERALRRGDDPALLVAAVIAFVAWPKHEPPKADSNPGAGARPPIVEKSAAPISEADIASDEAETTSGDDA